MNSILTKCLCICTFLALPFLISAQTLSRAELFSPANGAVNQPSTITLKWHSVKGADQYKVSVSTLNHSNDVFWDSTYTDTTKVLTGLSNGTYVWRIKAVRKMPYDTSNWTLPAWTFVVGTTTTGGSTGTKGNTSALSVPYLSAPSTGAILQVLGTNLVWQNVSGATFYKVKVATDAAFTNVIFTDNNVMTNSRVAQNLVYNTTYYWNVQAANTTTTTAASSTGSFTTMLDNPNIVTTHPRLMFTQADLPRLRSWAVPSNPVYVSMQTALNYAINIYNAKFFPGGVQNPNWPDNGGTTWTAYVTESYAEYFAFWSLIDPNVNNRILHAQRARNLLMYVIDQASLGYAAGVPFRDPQFMTYDRSRVYGEACPLTVDWIYDAKDANNINILTSADKAKIRNVFLGWCNDQLTAYNHPNPIGVVNDISMRPNRWTLNNYYSGHARNLTYMSLSMDAVDDAPVNANLHFSALGNSLKSYIYNVTGAWLYLQYTMFEQPNLVATDYGISPATKNLSSGSGGLAVEGSLYGESIGYVIQECLALKTAGWADTSVIGKQGKLITSAYWDRFMDGLLHGVPSAPKVFPQAAYLGSIYQGGLYGDLLRTWVTPEMIDATGPLGILDMLQGNKQQRLDKARWYSRNVIEGGAAALSQRVGGQWGNSYATHPIYYFMLLDPTTNSNPSDPRPNVPITFFDPAINRILARTDWTPNATQFDWHCHWTTINHQSGDGNQFELFRKGEWLIKERSGYANDGVGYTSEFHNTLGLQNDVPGNLQFYEYATSQRGGQWTNGQNAGDPTVITDFGSNYIYATGDATNLYNRPNQYTTSNNATDILFAVRSIVWLKPDHVIVYDRAKSKTANRFKRFFLQFIAPPTITGKNATISTPIGQKLYLSNLMPANSVLTTTVSENFSSVAQLDPTHDEIKIEDPSNPTDVRFLNVLQGADGNVSKDPVTLVQSSSGTAFDGTIVKNTAVMFPNLWGGTFSTTTYTIPNTVTQHIITGMAPNSSYNAVGLNVGANVQITITPNGSFQANAGGVLVINTLSIPTSLAVPVSQPYVRSAILDNHSVELYQNVPNPFSKNTTISFNLSESTNVTLRIIDITGKAIAMPVNNEKMDAGYHETIFNSGNLPSGIYLYEMQAGENRITRRMIVN